MTIAQAEDWNARLGAFAARIRTETNVPGISIATTIRGRRSCVAAGVGRGGVPLTAAARFELGAIGQLFLALFVLELEREGMLMLDAPLAEYLPELRGSICGSGVRVAHLLSHTGGYRGPSAHDAETRRFDLEALLACLRVAPQLFPPGAVFSFEHSGPALLGEIVRRVTGRATLAAVHDDMLALLGVARRGRGESDSDPAFAGRHETDNQAGCFKAAAPGSHAASWSALWCTASSPMALDLLELLTVAEAIVDTLPRATVERLTTPVVTLPAAIGGPLREFLPSAFGGGVARFRDGFCGSASSTRGHCVALRFDVAARAAVAVGINAAVPYLRDFVLAAVCSDLGGRPAMLERPAVPFALAELAGSYLGPGGGRVEARLDGEALVCEIDRDGASATLRGTITLDADNRAVLVSTAADLALAFFRVPGGSDIGLMLGASAYKRVASGA